MRARRGRRGVTIMGSRLRSTMDSSMVGISSRADTTSITGSITRRRKGSRRRRSSSRGRRAWIMSTRPSCLKLLLDVLGRLARAPA